MPRPLIAALAVALLGLAFVATGYTNPGGMCAYVDPHGEWIPDGVTFLPPGAAECHRHIGARTVHTTVLPWGDWATVALIAAAAGLFLAALEARRRKAAKAIGAYALFWVALVAWFIEDPFVWAGLAAITAALVVSARGWNHGRVA